MTLSHLSPAERLALHRRAPAWLCGIRGEPRLIRGIPATVRGGYAPRLIVACAWCGDLRDETGWHIGTTLVQHSVSHTMCPDCLVDYHPFSDRMLRLERTAA